MLTPTGRRHHGPGEVRQGDHRVETDADGTRLRPHVSPDHGSTAVIRCYDEGRPLYRAVRTETAEGKRFYLQHLVRHQWCRLCVACTTLTAQDAVALDVAESASVIEEDLGQRLRRRPVFRASRG